MRFDRHHWNRLCSTASRGWRARIWLPGTVLAGRDRDEKTRLWLLLDDGRVLVFRLAGTAPGDALLDRLAQSVAADARGDLLEIQADAPTGARFLVLYGAPASPVYCIDQANPAFGRSMRSLATCLRSEAFSAGIGWLVPVLSGPAMSRFGSRSNSAIRRSMSRWWI